MGLTPVFWMVISEEQPTSKGYFCLDSDWFSRFSNPNNTAFFSFLWGEQIGVTAYTCFISDPRVLDGGEELIYHPNDYFSPARDSISMTVLEVDLSVPIPGPVWLPLLNPSDRWTALELENIKIAIETYGGLLVGDLGSWAAYSRSILDIFQPSWSPGIKSTFHPDQTVWITDFGNVTISFTNYFDSDVTIPSSHILATTGGSSPAFRPTVVQVFP